MSEVGAIEAVAGVSEVIDDRPGRLRCRHFDDFGRIEPGAMLHGIQEHLAERGEQQVAVVAWGASTRVRS